MESGSGRRHGPWGQQRAARQLAGQCPEHSPLPGWDSFLLPQCSLCGAGPMAPLCRPQEPRAYGKGWPGGLQAPACSHSSGHGVPHPVPRQKENQGTTLEPCGKAKDHSEGPQRATQVSQTCCPLPRRRWFLCSQESKLALACRHRGWEQGPHVASSLKNGHSSLIIF